MTVHPKGRSSAYRASGLYSDLPAALYDVLPHPPPVVRPIPEAQVSRDEILDGGTRIVGYRFRAVATGASPAGMSPAGKFKALKDDNLASFTTHRMALVPITADEWRTLDYRMFATPNALFHVAGADSGGFAAWLDTLRDIRRSGAGVVLDGKVVDGGGGAALELADAVLVTPRDYSARGFGRELDALRARCRGNIVADGVASWDEYYECLDMGVQYCLGSFTATPFKPDAARQRAAVPDVLNCRLVQFHWYRVFECGQEDIDHDHEALFALANDFLAGVIARRGFDTMCGTVDLLVEKANEHFLREEAILSSLGYPRAAQHAALHRNLAAKASRLVGDFKAGKIEIGPVFEFLAEDMIVGHMLGADREFFPYLRQQGGGETVALSGGAAGAPTGREADSPC